MICSNQCHSPGSESPKTNHERVSKADTTYICAVKPRSGQTVDPIRLVRDKKKQDQIGGRKGGGLWFVQQRRPVSWTDERAQTSKSS